MADSVFGVCHHEVGSQKHESVVESWRDFLNYMNDSEPSAQLTGCGGRKAQNFFSAEGWLKRKFLNTWQVMIGRIIHSNEVISSFSVYHMP